MAATCETQLTPNLNLAKRLNQNGVQHLHGGKYNEARNLFQRSCEVIDQALKVITHSPSRESGQTYIDFNRLKVRLLVNKGWAEVLGDTLKSGHGTLLRSQNTANHALSTFQQPIPSSFCSDTGDRLPCSQDVEEDFGKAIISYTPTVQSMDYPVPWVVTDCFRVMGKWVAEQNSWNEELVVTFFHVGEIFSLFRKTDLALTFFEQARDLLDCGERPEIRCIDAVCLDFKIKQLCEGASETEWNRMSIEAIKERQRCIVDEFAEARRLLQQQMSDLKTQGKSQKSELTKLEKELQSLQELKNHIPLLLEAARNYELEKRDDELLNKIFSHPDYGEFYFALYAGLNNVFLACDVLASGMVEYKQGRISLVGKITGILGSMVSSVLDFLTFHVYGFVAEVVSACLDCFTEGWHKMHACMGERRANKVSAALGLVDKKMLVKKIIIHISEENKGEEKSPDNGIEGKAEKAKKMVINMVNGICKRSQNDSRLSLESAFNLMLESRT